MKPRNLGPNRPMLRRVAGMTAKPDGGVPQGRRLPLEAILSTAFLTVKYLYFRVQSHCVLRFLSPPIRHLPGVYTAARRQFAAQLFESSGCSPPGTGASLQFSGVGALPATRVCYLVSCSHKRVVQSHTRSLVPVCLWSDFSAQSEC